MYKQIINDYRAKYLAEPRSLADLAAAARRAHLALSHAATSRLDALAAESSALKIGVVGQFSSGKSTLLNLFLPEPVLATGARPTSVIAVFIKQGDFKVLARRGGEIYEASGAQNDQNSAAAMPDELHVFSPDERLANIELIDTPGLNANDSDEQFTRALFERFDAVIWLSHAAAAAKASERAAIAELPDCARICLITQADLLTPEAQQQTLAHARANFGELFSSVVLFSSHYAASGRKDSGMSELVGFLSALGPHARKAKIARNLGDIRAQIAAASKSALADLKVFCEHLALASESANAFANADELGATATAVLDAIEQSAGQIAALIAEQLREKTAAIYRPARGFLAKNRYERSEYTYKTLRPSDVAAEIFYNRDDFRRELKALERAISSRFAALADAAKEPANRLGAALAHERTRVLGTSAADAVAPSFSQPARQFFEQLSERVMGEFLRAGDECADKIELSCAQLAAKALGNFETAVALTSAFLHEKITSSREFYEQNSVEFKLYVPSEAEIKRRLLGDLCYYEFEEMLVNKGILKRFAADFAARFGAHASDLSEQAAAASQRIKERENEIAKMFQSVEY